MSSVTPDPDAVERSRDRRADAFVARNVLWHESVLKRVQSCGRWSVKTDGSVAIRSTLTADGRRAAGYAGVPSCGSVWSCPVCARKIAAERQREIERACDYWESIGGALALGTFTVSHHRTNSLVSVWDAVTAGWHGITSGSAWIRNKGRYGVEGWVRLVEVTVGVNGWHVHVHTVLFLTRGLGQKVRDALTAAMHGRWNTGIGKHGFRSSRERGADIKMMHGAQASRVLSDYFTKGVYTPDGSAGASVALEAARGDLKESRGGTRTPFRVLKDFVRHGEVEELDTWHEWERGSKGRRQIAWSKGFRQMVNLLDERSDNDIAEEEIGSAADDVVILPKASFALIRYTLHEPLDVLEVGGPAALRSWLSQMDIPWLEPGEVRTGPPE